MLPLVAADPSSELLLYLIFLILIFSLFLDVYNAARRLVETTSLLNSANETVRKAGIAHTTALLDLQHLTMHQTSGAPDGLWSDTFESMVPIKRLRQMDTQALQDQLEELRANTYGPLDLHQFPGVAAALAAADVDMDEASELSEREPVAGPSHSRGYINTRPSS